MTSTSGTTTQAVLLRPLAPETLASALAQLQADLPDVGKDKTAKVQSRDGKSSYTYDYANLASILRAVRPKMGPLGLAFTAKPTTVFRDNGQPEFVLEYKLIHGPSGESEAGEWPLPDPTRTTPQQVGSAITYARRYAFCAVIGLAPDDDDDDAQAAPKAARGKAPVRAPANLPRNQDGSISRGKVTDEEFAAAGMMTDAELRDHNRLEREVKGINSKGQLIDGTEVERLAATPDDDPWAQVTPLRQPQAAPPKAGVIHQHFGRILRPEGGQETTEQRLERLGFLGGIVGRKVTSVNDLTAVEGIEAARFLGGCKNREALVEKLALRAGESVDA